jgi:hypothetical protein
MVKKRKPRTSAMRRSGKRPGGALQVARTALKKAQPPRPRRHSAAARGVVSPPTAQDTVRTIVDKYCGPEGERIVQALSVLALGHSAARLAFFGEPVKVQSKDRVNALQQLGLRRWGRPGITLDLDPADPSRLPVQIVNVYAELPDADDE